MKRLCFEADTEPYAKERDAKILQLAEAAGVEVHAPISHTLFVSVGHVERMSGQSGVPRVPSSIFTPVKPAGTTAALKFCALVTCALVTCAPVCT